MMACAASSPTGRRYVDVAFKMRRAASFGLWGFAIGQARPALPQSLMAAPEPLLPLLQADASILQRVLHDMIEFQSALPDGR